MITICEAIMDMISVSKLLFVNPVRKVMVNEVMAYECSMKKLSFVVS